ncbi:hypothetical protein SLEP1_g9581 [Rubroshorea leprosula]|uniref:FAS1 domain-containing protein n=1 Tax=Rubroshorea leprosula TaxID=152421 RepID=A0AAV5IEP7_9ROSI|nr:hypothetical protein SLEP1_g9581 [Rubroshorea leprosula]
MAATSLPLIFFTLCLLSPLTLAQTPAPTSSPSPTNLTGILDKNGQYTTFIRLLNDTQIFNQVENQLNNSNNGLTVLAPTDNAFNNLPSGTINSLTQQQKVQLCLYHILPQYYSLNDLQLVSNPVRTQATGNDGVWGLNFTGQNNQVNVTSGAVTTQISNALSQQKPLAVYQVDKVLLPEELTGGSPSTISSPAPTSSPAKANTTVSSAKEPSPAGSGACQSNMGLGLVVGLAMVCMGAVSS